MPELSSRHQLISTVPFIEGKRGAPGILLQNPKFEEAFESLVTLSAWDPGQAASWRQENGKHIKESQKEVQFGSFLGDFTERLTSELSLQRKGDWNGKQRQYHADGIAGGQYTEDDVWHEK